jgi:hypothetical protein
MSFQYQYTRFIIEDRLGLPARVARCLWPWRAVPPLAPGIPELIININYIRLHRERLCVKDLSGDGNGLPVLICHFQPRGKSSQIEVNQVFRWSNSTVLKDGWKHSHWS